MSKLTKILALDLAHSCGYAIYENGQIIEHGVWNLRQHNRGEEEQPQIRLVKLLEYTIRNYNIEHIVLEDVYLPVNDGKSPYKSYSPFISLTKLHGLVEYVCATYNVSYSRINAMQAKRFMFRANNRMNRDTLKSLMIREVERLGYELQKQHTDDEADAIGILCTFLNEKIECR